LLREAEFISSQSESLVRESIAQNEPAILTISLLSGKDANRNIRRLKQTKTEYAKLE
jgi:hypothetical protein